jgi:hypothetical protein
MVRWGLATNPAGSANQVRLASDQAKVDVSGATQENREAKRGLKMGKFTLLDDTTEVASVTLHVGDGKTKGTQGHKRLHLAGVAEEDGRSSLIVASSDDATASGTVLRIPYDADAGIWIVDLDAKKKGKATLQAKVKGAAVAKLEVTVEDRLQLPAPNTQAGLLARLFLAETASPETQGVKWSVADAKKSMQWMRLVLQNRLANNPEQFMARGAKTLQDIVTAQDKGKLQYQGFGKYPALDSDIQLRIEDVFRMANDDNHKLQADYAAFIRTALEVASDTSVVQDPCGTDNFLSGWMTVNHSPGDTSVPFQVLMDNQFFMMKRKK